MTTVKHYTNTFEGLLEDQVSPTALSVRELLTRAEALEDQAYALVAARLHHDNHPEGYSDDMLDVFLDPDDQVVVEIDLRDSIDETPASVLADHGIALKELGVDHIVVLRPPGYGDVATGNCTLSGDEVVRALGRVVRAHQDLTKAQEAVGAHDLGTDE